MTPRQKNSLIVWIWILVLLMGLFYFFYKWNKALGQEEIPAPIDEIHSILVKKPNEFRGTVTSVYDGDTINVQVTNVPEGAKQRYPEVAKVRLAGIDAPEIAQEYGREAGSLLGWLVGGKQIRIKWVEKDRYGRYIGLIMPEFGQKVTNSTENGSINAVMLENGLAWHYKAYDKSLSFSEKESVAKGSLIGLWAAEKPEPPWDYRKKRRPKDVTSPARVGETVPRR